MHNSSLSCTPDEVLLSSSFARLDLDGDGQWTFAEALNLSEAYARDTGHQVNVSQLYKNVFRTMQQHAGPRIALCQTDEEAEVLSVSGNWLPAQIGNISSDDMVNVEYLEEWEEEVYFYVPPEYVRKRENDTIYACSFRKCVDMETGATDSLGGDCTTYHGFEVSPCAGEWDDEDFRVQELCCTCNGGSQSLTLTGLGHLPVDIPIEDLVSKEFRLCMQAALEEAQQHQCIANFTAIPGDLYEREIARYTHFCLVPEADICGNLDGRELLPDLDFDLLTSIPLFLKVAGIASTASLGQVNLCRRAVQSFCQQIYTVQTTLLQEQRADICGKKSGKVVGSKKTIRYEASREYEDEVFGLTSVTFQSFLLIILFLWGLASVTEFRSILVWWNVILTLPTAVAAACIVYKYPPGAEAEDDCTVEIAGLTWKTRLSTVFTNLLPRTVLQCVFFVVGIEYLLSVKQISELILNSLALMVLVTIDEMLFAAFTGEQNAIWIQNSEPLQGRSLHWLDCLLSVTHMPLGMFIFLPISATLAFYIQSHVTTTALQAQATYCLCDLKGDDCFAPEFLAGRVAAAL
ncbi:unnamed protein product [Symbiodinium microadriaticum]|nr:unnamed protein product [Symbiodinium microadriaticum]